MAPLPALAQENQATVVLQKGFKYGRRQVQLTVTRDSHGVETFKVWYNRADLETSIMEWFYQREARNQGYGGTQIDPKKDDWERPLSAEERGANYLPKKKDLLQEQTITLRSNSTENFITAERLIFSEAKGVGWLIEPHLKDFFNRNRAQLELFAEKLRQEQAAWLQDGYYQDVELEKKTFLDYYDFFIHNKAIASEDWENSHLREHFRRDVAAGKVGIPTLQQVGQNFVDCRTAQHPLFVTHEEKPLDCHCKVQQPIQQLIDEFERRSLPIFELGHYASGLEGWERQLTSVTSITQRSAGGEHSIYVDCPEMTSTGNWFTWCQSVTVRCLTDRFFAKHPGQTFTVHVPTRTTMMPPLTKPLPKELDTKTSLAEYLDKYGIEVFKTNFESAFRRNYSNLATTVQVDVDEITVATYTDLKSQLDSDPRRRPGNTLVLKLWHKKPHPMLIKH